MNTHNMRTRTRSGAITGKTYRVNRVYTKKSVQLTPMEDITVAILAGMGDVGDVGEMDTCDTMDTSPSKMMKMDNMGDVGDVVEGITPVESIPIVEVIPPLSMPIEETDETDQRDEYNDDAISAEISDISSESGESDDDVIEVIDEDDANKDDDNAGFSAAQCELIRKIETRDRINKGLPPLTEEEFKEYINRRLHGREEKAKKVYAFLKQSRESTIIVID